MQVFEPLSIETHSADLIVARTFGDEKKLEELTGVTLTSVFCGVFQARKRPFVIRSNP
jgi:hypothetical protein